MMRFGRTVSVKHHRSGDHYQIAIPAQVAQALDLQDGGGLVSIELADKAVRLQAYRDSPIAWREQIFDPSSPRVVSKAVAVPPRTLGPSKPWATGKVTDFKQIIRELRAGRLWVSAELRKAFPRRRGRKRRRW